MAAYIYVRVSTREQALDGLSLAAQVRECLAFCQREGITLHPFATNCDSPGVFADPGVSAWKCRLLERPGFSALWDCLQPGDEVIFYAFNRAFRSTVDFLKTWEIFREKQISPIFVANSIDMTTASGKMWATVLAAFSEFQSAINSERVREAQAIKKAIRDGNEVPHTAGASAARRSTEKKAQKSSGKESVSPELLGSWMWRDAQAARDNRPKPNRIFGYVRVSTTSQDLLAQVNQVQSNLDYFASQGYAPAGIHQDFGVSAFKNDFRDREAGGIIWDQLQPGDAIVACKLDRICRSAVDVAFTLRHFEKSGVRLIIPRQVDTWTEAGRNFAHLLGTLGEMESATIRHHTMLALKLRYQTKGPWQDGRHPRWVERYESEGIVQWRVRIEVIQDILQMRELSEQGLSNREISDVMQLQHEAKWNLPIHIPVIGFKSRFQVEQKLRMKQQWAELNVFRDYCDHYGIKSKMPVERFYGITDGDRLCEIWGLVYAAKRLSLSRWIKEHEEWISSKVG